MSRWPAERRFTARTPGKSDAVAASTPASLTHCESDPFAAPTQVRPTVDNNGLKPIVGAPSPLIRESQSTQRLVGAP